jgi:hypothetical protein
MFFTNSVGHALGPATEDRGQFVLQRRLDSVGSSEKKEKRRRRNPAYGSVRPDIERPVVVSKTIR